MDTIHEAIAVALEAVSAIRVHTQLIHCQVANTDKYVHDVGGWIGAVIVY
jgi:hypothetical protein